MFQGIRRRLTFANVVAALALFFALGSSSLAEPVRNGAVQLIRSQHIGSGEVTSRHIESHAVTSRHVRDGSLRSADVRRNTLRARDLRRGVAATDVLGTARFRRGARRPAVGSAPARASQSGGGLCGAVGQVVLFGGDYAPRGTAPARGQLLSISQNQALFSIYGTRFGGDGRVTFGLPDLSGAEPKGLDGQPVGYLVCLEGVYPGRP
jgi:tail collar domain